MSSHFSGDEMEIQCNREGKYKSVQEENPGIKGGYIADSSFLSFMPSSKSRADQGLSLSQEFPKKATAVSSE